MTDRLVNRLAGRAAAQSGYEAMAEFHDLFMVEAWERLRSHVREAFAQLPADATIVEIGAGTGMGSRVIAQESAAHVVALEPDLVMRSILTARVADDPALTSRITVVAGSAPVDLGLLPGRFDGFVCAHVLGHLDEPERRDLFAGIAAHLNNGGVGLAASPGKVDLRSGVRGARWLPLTWRADLARCG